MPVLRDSKGYIVEWSYFSLYSMITLKIMLMQTKNGFLYLLALIKNHSHKTIILVIRIKMKIFLNISNLLLFLYKSVYGTSIHLHGSNLDTVFRIFPKYEIFLSRHIFSYLNIFFIMNLVFFL